jgi:DNA-binding MarR family transcriptional regulator
MYDRHLRPHGIESTQFALLEALEGLGPRSQTAVGLGFGLEKTTLSRNLRVLASKGWVEATAGEDSRERLYQLTPAGRKTLQAARPAWRRAQTDLRTRLGPAQWEATWRAFRAVTEIAGGPSTQPRFREGMKGGACRRHGSERHVFVPPAKRLASLARSSHDSSAPSRATHSFISLPCPGSK